MGTFAALILIASPVRGLRPVRAARLPTAKVPKPTKETDPPFLSVVFTAPMVDSNARVAAALEISACFAMCSISSVLFTKTPCRQADLVELSLNYIHVSNRDCCASLKLRGFPVSIRHAKLLQSGREFYSVFQEKYFDLDGNFCANRTGRNFTFLARNRQLNNALFSAVTVHALLFRERLFEGNKPWTKRSKRQRPISAKRPIHGY